MTYRNFDNSLNIFNNSWTGQPTGRVGSHVTQYQHSISTIAMHKGPKWRRSDDLQDVGLDLLTIVKGESWLGHHFSSQQKIEDETTDAHAAICRLESIPRAVEHSLPQAVCFRNKPFLFWFAKPALLHFRLITFKLANLLVPTNRWRSAISNCSYSTRH